MADVTLDNLEALDADILHLDSDLTDVEVDIDDLIKALKDYGETFIQFFLAQELTYPVPDFHKNKIWPMMIKQEIKKVAIAVPRGHAKTTLAKLAVIWHFLFGNVRFAVYLSNTAAIAISACKDIIDFMQCENFKSVFGEVLFRKRNEGDGHYEFEFQGKYFILIAKGSKQQMRGLNINNQRPQLAIVDDFEDIENTETPRLQQKLDSWFFRTFVKALDQVDSKIIFIGNMISNTCLLSRLISLKSWTSMRMGAMLSNGKTLWPELWPLDKLMEDYAEYQAVGETASWMAEMMNLPTAGDNALIKSNQINFVPPVVPEDLLAGFVTIDPATGTGNDDTAIVVHGLIQRNDSEDYYPVIVDYEFGKIDETNTVHTALRLCIKWGVSVIGIESVAFQRVMLSLFELVIAANYPGMSFETLPLTPGRASKLERIRAWCAQLKKTKDDGEPCTPGTGIVMNEVHIESQLLDFNVARKDNTDDLIDACAYQVPMMQSYLGLVLNAGMQKVIAHKAQRQAEVCN